MIFKREMKVNSKSFLIWFSVIAMLLLLIIGIYPTMIENADSFTEMLKIFPESMLEVFGFDELVFDNVYNWYGTEGYMYISLILGCYAAILGATILSKEESEKTIEFLLSKPITRNTIIIQKLLSVFTLLLAMVLLIAITNFIGFMIVDYINIKLWLLLNLAIFIQALTFGSLSFLIGCFITKSKQAISAGLGLVLGTYMLFVVSVISSKLAFLKYFSPFEYISSKYILDNTSLNPFYTALMIIIIVVSITLSFKIYNKKDITV